MKGAVTILQTSLSKRNSGIEVLKILAIVLIVTSHVVQTVGTKGNAYISFSDYWVELTAATRKVPVLLLAMLRYSGELGNTIFFVCSAWFLLEKDRVDKKKILTILLDIWLVSVTILLTVLLLRHGQLDIRLILFSLFPTLFENNWYLTLYLIFYALHPALNLVVRRFERKSLFRLVFFGVLLYFVICFVNRLNNSLFDKGATFFVSRLIVWAIIYLLLGYLKTYAGGFLDSRRSGLVMLVVGFVGYYGLVPLTNLLGLQFAAFKKSLMLWYVPYNPFLLLLVLGLFVLFKGRVFHSRVINYVSGLSLYIYIIHENILLRWLYRPAIWRYIHDTYGYRHIVLWVLVLVLAIFAFGALAAILYRETLHRLVVLASGKIYPFFSGKWRKMENRLFSR